MGIETFPEKEFPDWLADPRPRGVLVTVTAWNSAPQAVALGMGTVETAIMATQAVRTYPGRRYKLTGWVHQGSGTQNYLATRWRQGNGIAGTVLNQMNHARNSTGPWLPALCVAYDVPGDNPAMVWTYTCFMNVGAGDIYNPSHYTVEDVGAV